MFKLKLIFYHSLVFSTIPLTNHSWQRIFLNPNLFFIIHSFFPQRMTKPKSQLSPSPQKHHLTNAFHRRTPQQTGQLPSMCHASLSRAIPFFLENDPSRTYFIRCKKGLQKRGDRMRHPGKILFRCPRHSDFEGLMELLELHKGLCWTKEYRVQQLWKNAGVGYWFFFI